VEKKHYGRKKKKRETQKKEKEKEKGRMTANLIFSNAFAP